MRISWKMELIAALAFRKHRPHSEINPFSPSESLKRFLTPKIANKDEPIVTYHRISWESRCR
jgi:hypothetical protein